MASKALVKPEPDDTRGLGPAMKALTPKHRRFVIALFEFPKRHGRVAAAARAAGYGLDSDPDSVAVMGHQISHREDVQKAIAEFALKRVHVNAPDAVAAFEQIMSDPLHKDRLKAASGYLERITPTVQKVEVTHEVVVDHKRDALEHLKHLKSIGATREMLEREFGYSGLGYYEDLLAKEEAAKLPVVDAEFTEVDEVDWSKEKADE
jgi:phage terminase small subunit